MPCTPITRPVCFTQTGIAEQTVTFVLGNGQFSMRPDSSQVETDATPPCTNHCPNYRACCGEASPVVRKKTRRHVQVVALVAAILAGRQSQRLWCNSLGGSQCLCSDRF